MKVNYDARTDTLTVVFRDVPVAESDEDKPGVILDYDAAGNIVSIEVLDASRRVEDPRKVTVETDGEAFQSREPDCGGVGWVVKRRVSAATGCSAALSSHWRASADAGVAARGQAGGGMHERARRRAETSGGGCGYQVRRWSNSKAGAGWAWGSISRCPAGGISHSGGPRAGAAVGGVIGAPRWTRMSRTAGASVMKAMMRIVPPQLAQRSGNTSSHRDFLRS